MSNDVQEVDVEVEVERCSCGNGTCPYCSGGGCHICNDSGDCQVCNGSGEVYNG